MKNVDGVGAGRDAQTSAPRRARWSGLVDYALHMEQVDGSVWPCHGVCSLLPGRTMAGDTVRGAVVIAAGGWDGKQPGGQRVQICKELVSVSSTAGREAFLLHCLAGGEGRGL